MLRLGSLWSLTVNVAVEQVTAGLVTVGRLKNERYWEGALERKTESDAPSIPRAARCDAELCNWRCSHSVCFSFCSNTLAKRWRRENKKTLLTFCCYMNFHLNFIPELHFYPPKTVPTNTQSLLRSLSIKRKTDRWDAGKWIARWKERLWNLTCWESILGASVWFSNISFFTFFLSLWRYWTFSLLPWHESIVSYHPFN